MLAPDSGATSLDVLKISGTASPARAYVEDVYSVLPGNDINNQVPVVLDATIKNARMTSATGNLYNSAPGTSTGTVIRVAQCFVNGSAPINLQQPASVYIDQIDANVATSTGIVQASHADASPVTIYCDIDTERGAGVLASKSATQTVTTFTPTYNSTSI